MIISESFSRVSQALFARKLRPLEIFGQHRRMTEAEIRNMKDRDTDQVIALWHASGVSRPWNDPARDIAFARRGAHSTVLVAELGGKVVASAMVGEDGHRGWVHYVAADPAHQGTGLGRMMMDAAEQWLRARGVWKVQLLVRADNAAVRQFYEHLGYRDTRSVCFQKIIEES
jgi:ribosomal protein S18 acetylase RimI-like enzyme